jgi:hypothetical protein
MTTETHVAPARRAVPLSEGELAAAKAVAALVATLGLLGFVNSFRAVAKAAQSSFGQLAPTVPLGVDLAILVFSALDIVLARLDMRPRWVRWVPWTLTAATIYLNVADQVTWFGRVAHAVFPALWVVAVSLAAHVIRIRAQLAAGTRMDRIRVSRWMLAPASTAALWRRMVLWEIRSYPQALGKERERVLALTGLQDDYGTIAWRWRAPRRTRALYRLGELTPAGPVQHGEDRTDSGEDTGARTDREPRTSLPAAAPSTGTAYGNRDPRTEPGDVDRDAVIDAIADEIRDAIDAGDRWVPDYPALMAATGRRRSWCEKAVREARDKVLDPPPDRAEPVRVSHPVQPPAATLVTVRSTPPPRTAVRIRPPDPVRTMRTPAASTPVRASRR